MRDLVCHGTAPHWAAKSGSEMAVTALIEAGSGLETRCSSGLAPLLAAASNEKWPRVQLLADRGADMNAKVMHFAAQTGSIETLQFLIARLGRGDIDARAAEDFGRCTWPLQVATPGVLSSSYITELR
jgi:ankyrin repeat protein